MRKWKAALTDGHEKIFKSLDIGARLLCHYDDTARQNYRHSQSELNIKIITDTLLYISIIILTRIVQSTGDEICCYK